MENAMDRENPPVSEEMTELIGLLVGRVAADGVALRVLAALLEEKGVLRPGELDAATRVFLRDGGLAHFIEHWGPDLGQGLYDGYIDAQISGLDTP